VPLLQEISLDQKENSQIRVYAVSVIGELDSRNAADALIEILPQDNFLK
jgi:HEAT repeat protein